MSRPAFRRLRVVRYLPLVVVLFALGGSSLFAQSARPGVLVDGIARIYGCSHDGFEAFGRASLVEGLAGLRYWQYDPSTGSGTTTAFPEVDGIDMSTPSFSTFFPKDGVGFFYVEDSEAALWAWDVADGTVTRVRDDVQVQCVSDDGEIVYAVDYPGAWKMRLLRIRRSAGGFEIDVVRSWEDTLARGVHHFDSAICSADGALYLTERYLNEDGNHDGARLSKFANGESSSTGLDVPGDVTTIVPACSPDGELAVLQYYPFYYEYLTYITDSGADERPYDAGYEGAFRMGRVDDDGVAYGEFVSNEPYAVRSLFFDPATGETLLVPLPPGFEEHRDVSQPLIGASPGGGTFVYKIYGKDDSHSDYWGTFRYDRASGAIENVRDVVHEDISDVFAVSRDTTRMYVTITDEDGWDVRFIVEPPADETPPTVESATIGADGRTFSIVFSETVTDVLPPTLNFTHGPVTAAYESGNGTTVLRYALSRTLEKNEEGIYELAPGAVQDAAGNANESASGPVLNRSRFVFDLKPPKAVSARINAAGDTLTIVFSENVVHRRHPKLELSGGRVVARYESGTGSRAISYDLSRIVRKGEVGKCSLVAGAVVDAAKNRIEAVTRRLENRSKSRDDDGSRRKIKSDRRPSGTSANDYCDAAYQQASGILSEPGGYTAYGYTAFACAYNSALYRYECGERIRYGEEIGLTRDEALAIYKSDRYLQRLYAYYAQTYAYEEYCQTSSTSSLYACLFAAYSSAYGADDLIAK